MDNKKFNSKLKMFISFFIIALVFSKAISMSPRMVKIEEFREMETKKSQSKYLASTITVDDKKRSIVNNPDDNLVLINKDRYLPDGYKPKDLVVPDVDFSFDEDVDKRYLRKEAAEHLEKLFKAAKKDGIELYASSGYRPYERQVELFNAKLEKDGEAEAKRLVAMPGQSEHQTGLAMDVTSREIKFLLEKEFEDTKEGKWIKDNSHKFGFIIRYPKEKENITLYSYEPWHIRYVGKDAETIYKEKVSLEEFLANK